MIPRAVVEAANAAWEKPCRKTSGELCPHCYAMSEAQARAVLAAAVDALPDSMAGHARIEGDGWYGDAPRSTLLRALTGDDGGGG